MAIEPVEYLQKIGIDASFLTEEEVRELGSDSVFKDLDIIVFVKACCISYLKKAHSKGIKTVWYADESLMTESELMLKNKKYIDSIVSTCDAYTELCRELGFSSQYIEAVYHHHCNFSNEIVTFNKKVKNVGFVGMNDQLHRKDEFRSFLKNHDCNLIASQAGAAFKTDLFKVLRKTDLGIIFMEKDRTEGIGGIEKTWGDRMKYRSNTKIVNFISFGIPCVTVPYNSYTEVLKDKSMCCLTVNSFKDACDNLELLIKNVQLRKTIRANCLHHRDDFHLTNTVKGFVNLFKYLLE